MLLNFTYVARGGRQGRGRDRGSEGWRDAGRVAGRNRGIGEEGKIKVGREVGTERGMDGRWKGGREERGKVGGEIGGRGEKDAGQGGRN